MLDNLPSDTGDDSGGEQIGESHVWEDEPADKGDESAMQDMAERIPIRDMLGITAGKDRPNPKSHFTTGADRRLATSVKCDRD
jgi:hypothetical protein